MAYGHGLDILRQRDPHCFMDRSTADRQRVAVSELAAHI
jgi:hypothetical protein